MIHELRPFVMHMMYLGQADLAYLSLFTPQLLRNPVLVKDTRYLRHPVLPIDTEKFSLWWQLPWPIHRSRHNIAKLVSSPFPILENAAATSRAELSV